MEESDYSCMPHTLFMNNITDSLLTQDEETLTSGSSDDESGG